MVSDLKFGPSSCKDSTYPASPSSVSNSCFFFLILFLLSPRHSLGRRNVSNFEGASYERTAYDRFIPLFLVRQNLGGSIEPWVPTPLPSSKYLARIFFRLSFFFFCLLSHPPEQLLLRIYNYRWIHWRKFQYMQHWEPSWSCWIYQRSLSRIHYRQVVSKLHWVSALKLFFFSILYLCSALDM